MKKFKFNYVETLEGKTVLKEGNNVLNDYECKKDLVKYEIFNKIYSHYKIKHTYSEIYYNNVEKFQNSILEGVLDMKRVKRLMDNPDIMNYLNILDTPDGIEYIKTRANYVWTLCELAENGELLEWMEMTDVFNPEIKFKDKIAQDYVSDYETIVYDLCKEV